MSKFKVGDKVRYAEGYLKDEEHVIAEWTKDFPQAEDEYQFTNGCWSWGRRLELIEPATPKSKEPICYGIAPRSTQEAQLRKMVAEGSASDKPKEIALPSGWWILPAAAAGAWMWYTVIHWIYTLL